MVEYAVLHSRNRIIDFCPCRVGVIDKEIHNTFAGLAGLLHLHPIRAAAGIETSVGLAQSFKDVFPCVSKESDGFCDMLLCDPLASFAPSHRLRYRENRLRIPCI